MNALTDDIKQLVEKDITSCKQCKKCLLVCPLPESDDIDIFHLNQEILSDKPSKKMLEFSYLCFSCGACNYSCPEYDRRDLHFVYLRTKGKLPKGFNNLLHWRGVRLGLMESKLYSLKRLKDKPHKSITPYLDKKKLKRSELLFYFACYAFSPSEIPRKTLALADHLGFEYEVMAGYSYCCGWPHFLAGDLQRAQPLFEDLYAAITNTGAKTVVTGCAECYSALKFIQERYAGTYNVLTTSEWLVENLKKLKITKSDELVTFHDACQLSRLFKKEKTPRKLLKKLFNLIELEQNKEKTLCCGGMRASHEVKGLLKLRKKRLEDAKNTGAKRMITECVTCFEKYHPLETDIPVTDLLEAVYDNVLGSNVGER